MTDVIIPQASLFLGIIPALIILYVSLKDYEGHYKDKTIFLMFVIGIVFGFIAALVQSYTLAMVIIYAILLSFFNQLIKTIILNLRRFQEKSEGVINGLTLGLGFGSTFTPFLVIAVSQLKTSNFSVVSLIAIGSIGIILFQGATGAYIGYGIYFGKLTRYLSIAILLEIPFNFLMGVVISYSEPQYLAFLSALIVGMILYGGIVFIYVFKKVMPRILQKNQKRKRRKNK